MTAPVVMTGNNRADMTMQFILPSEFTMETAPKPTDPKVSLCQIPEKVVAVHTFSGWANLKTMEKEKQNQLLEALKKDGVRTMPC